MTTGYGSYMNIGLDFSQITKESIVSTKQRLQKKNTNTDMAQLKRNEAAAAAAEAKIK